MQFFTLFSKSIKKRLAFRSAMLLVLYLITAGQGLVAQNVFSGEPVQWVGMPNGFSTTPYNSDYRTLVYRKLSTTASNPTDGRAQWSTTINVQTSGGDITPDNMLGGPGAGWLLISGPASNRFQNKWNFTGVGQGALNSVNSVIFESSGQDMGLDMGTTGYYTFNMRDAGYQNTEFYVGYTASAPVTVSRTGETANTGTNGMIINITTGAAPSAGENIFVRYSSTANDFTTGTTVIQASGSNTTWSAEIPSQACGTTVYYYVYSSTRTLAQIGTDSESDRALAAIRYDDNAGANYSYVSSTAIINASAGANGTLTPPGITNYNCGDNATYTITPNAGCYSIQDVLVDGVSQGPVSTYTFTGLTGNHSISASFILNSFTITASAGTGGSISPNGASNVNCGDDISYTITADPCYNISGVSVDGTPVGAVSSYSFNNVTGNHTIVASFVQTPYTITVTQGANGTISPGTGTVNCGDNATYTITPDPCYSVQNVFVDGVPVGSVTSYTFNGVSANHTITASFEVITYSITATTDGNGTITPGGAPVYNCGSSVGYTITPDVCFHVLDVLVDGVSVGAVTSYSFNGISANHTISATFALNTSLGSPVISGPKNVCQYIGTGTPVTYTAVAQGAASYSWLLPPNVVLQSSTANTITVTFLNGFAAQANKQLRVTALSPCQNSVFSIYYLLTQAPGTTGPITGNTNACPIMGTAGTYTYTIPSSLGASSYVWTAQAGTTTITHLYTGANDTSVTVSFSAGFTTSAITVQSVNNCGVGSVRSLTITATAASVPSPISGPTNVCAYIAPDGTAATYSTTAVPGVTNNWTLPAGASNITGQGTSTISFIYPAGFTSGSISVTATNGCGGSAPRSLSVSTILPSATSVITAVETQGCPDRIVHYSVPAIPGNATSVLWTVPTSAGAVLISGQGTTGIDVSYPSPAVNGVVTAVATNNCGNSAVRSLAVHLTDCGSGPPPPPGPKAGKGQPTIITAAETLQVNMYPNPTVSDFRLQVVTAGKEQISVRILDMQGRAIKNLVVMPYQTTTIGADLNAGSYMVEVRQGTSVKVTKLMKF